VTGFDLDDLDSAFATAGNRKPVSELPHPDVPNGFYTLTFPCGTHKTFRIATQQQGPMAGRRIVSLLIGPQNTDDYESVGEIVRLDPPGIAPWKKFKGKKVGEYLDLLWAMLKGEKIEDHELIVSKRCLRCNRPLTTPESVARGIGPECERKG
jgi:hypothetical protein